MLRPYGWSSVPQWSSRPCRTSLLRSRLRIAPSRRRLLYRRAPNRVRQGVFLNGQRGKEYDHRQHLRKLTRGKNKMRDGAHNLAVEHGAERERPARRGLVLQIRRQGVDVRRRVQDFRDNLHPGRVSENVLRLRRGWGRRTSSASSPVMRARRLRASSVCVRVADKETPRTCPVVRNRYDTTSKSASEGNRTAPKTGRTSGSERDVIAGDARNEGEQGRSQHCGVPEALMTRHKLC